MEQFGKYAYYYNLFYQDKDYKTEALSVLDQLRKHIDTGKRVISLGCGTGKHENILGEKGCEVHGIDLSPEMVDIAKKKSFLWYCVF